MVFDYTRNTPDTIGRRRKLERQTASDRGPKPQNGRNICRHIAGHLQVRGDGDASPEPHGRYQSAQLN